jgi:eukaryotic-like serine/threonine-protein kinase
MKSIGKYQVTEALGASPTGKTYRVRDAFRNREFAVKILETVPGISAETKDQFCAYLASCSELTHRHIAKVFDLGEVEEGIFVATEWRTGTDLKRFMEENRDLALDQKLGVIAQVAEGLGFAHSRGIAHGNLKPSNIFVDASRDASILDFGVAKWLAALLDAGARPEGQVANYLAPEQILGEPFDARSDIFALGVMLYELVSGKYPFAADAGLIPREIVHSNPAPLGTFDPHIPEDLEKLVARSLAKSPAARLQTAEEFASGLYVAAQHYRRAAQAAAVEPLGPPSTDAFSEQLPPALTAAPVITPTPTAPADPVAATAFAPPPPPNPVKNDQRQRPQDVPSEPRAWTARSYQSGAPLPSAPSAERTPPPPMNPAPPMAIIPPPPEESGYQPPKSFLQPTQPEPPPAAPKPKKLGKGVFVVVAGLILAVLLVGSFVSHQNLKASQSIRNHPVTAAPQTTLAPVEPVAPPSAPPARPTKTEEPPPAPAEVVNPEISARQVLNGPVRTLWESGRYAQALALVNQVLATDPANEDARTWKKKIREAQAAEAALK